MKCNVVQTRLLRFLDGELSESEKQAIHQHLQSCEHCAGTLEKLTEVWRNQCPVQPVATDPFAWQKLYMKISALQDDAPLSRRAPRPWLKLAMAGGLAMLVLLGIRAGIFLGTVTQQPSELTPTQTTSEEQFVCMVHLDNFQDTPPGSLGSFYMAVSTVDQK